MDRLFRRQGLRHPGPLDRLAFIGDRAGAALRAGDRSACRGARLEPAGPGPGKRAGPGWRGGRCFARTGADRRVSARRAAQGPGAARRRDRSRQHARRCARRSWLVKFPAQGEHKEVCAVEQLYAELARDCGLEVPASALFDLSPRLAAFGVARFDRERGMRVPVHSLAGLLQVDFRMPGSTDYDLAAGHRLLTRDEREVERPMRAPSSTRCFTTRTIIRRTSHGVSGRIGVGDWRRIRPDVQRRTDGTASHGCVRRRRRGGTGSLAAAGQGGWGGLAHGRSHARPDG